MASTKFCFVAINAFLSASNFADEGIFVVIILVTRRHGQVLINVHSAITRPQHLLSGPGTGLYPILIAVNHTVGATAMSETCIITLSGEPPVRMVEAAWPRIARARIGCGPVAYSLNVRQHAAGRAIVYAVTRGDHEFADAAEWDDAKGVRLDTTESQGDGIVIAVRKAAREVFDAHESDLEAQGSADELIRKCLAVMPPVDLS